MASMEDLRKKQDRAWLISNKLMNFHFLGVTAFGPMFGSDQGEAWKFATKEAADKACALLNRAEDKFVVREVPR